MRRAHRIGTSLIWIGVLCSMLACTAPAAVPTQPAATTVPATATADTPNDTLRWSLEGVEDLAALDPAKPINNPTNIVIGLVYGGLIRLDANLEVQPEAAERWEVSPDGRVYTFFLRPDLQFADGTPVTAADFVYSINRALSPELTYDASYQLAQIEGAEEVAAGAADSASGVRALDAHTLEIRLKQPQAFFLSQLGYSYTYVVPRQLVESGGDWHEQAFGTGPYQVKEWIHGEKIVLTANEHYWHGRAGMPQVELYFYPDSEKALDDYLAGKLDIMGGQQNPIPTNRLEEVKQLPDFRTSAALVTRYIGFNNELAPFDRVAMRRAFAQSIDKEKLVDTVLAGAAEPATRILPTGLVGSDLPIRPLKFDPGAAVLDMQHAGYIAGSDVPSVTLAYADEGDNAAVAAYLQQDWQEHLGIDVALKAYALHDFEQMLNTTYYTPSAGLQMYLSVWGADYPDPQNFLSQQLRTGSPNNNGHYSNIAFDNLVDEADRQGKAEDFDRRLQLYVNAEQIVIDEVGWLPLFYPTFNTLIRPDIQGISVTPLGIAVPNWHSIKRTTE